MEKTMNDLMQFLGNFLAIIAIIAAIFVVVWFFLGKTDNEYSTMETDIELSDELQEIVTANNYYNSNTILSPLNEWRKKNGI
ncbi:MAG TPA: hypothetical protein VKR58_04260 [Aquella sp.]|nr:hypothetical protein [Aquella sp.]